MKPLNYKIKTIIYYLHRLCNNVCNYCLSNSGRKHGFKEGNYLDFDDIKRTTREFSHMGWPRQGQGTSVMSGGETTYRFNEIVDYLEFVRDDMHGKPGVHLVTNGGLIGAEGQYREMHKQALQRAGLYNLSAEEAVAMLKKAGLQSVALTADDEHVSLLDNTIVKVPFLSALNCMNAFVNKGYGIGDLTFNINSTYNKGEKEKSLTIVRKMMAQAGFSDSFSQFVRGDQRINKVYEEAQIMGEKSFRIPTNNNVPLDSIFAFNFTKFSGSYDMDKARNRQQVAVRWDGTVFLDDTLSIPIGHIGEGLTEIVRRLNAKEIDSEFGKNIEVIHILNELSTRDVQYNSNVGEALWLIYDDMPDIVSGITCVEHAMGLLGRDEQMKDALIRNFGFRRDEVLEKILEYDY